MTALIGEKSINQNSRRILHLLLENPIQEIEVLDGEKTSPNWKGLFLQSNKN